MELTKILMEFGNEDFHAYLQQHDTFYNERLDLLTSAQQVFQSEKKLTELASHERALILGLTTNRNNPYNFDPNLFGAPGGSGMVNKIITENYVFFDKFFAAIPRRGNISTEQFEDLVQLFRDALRESKCENFLFVFMTRILTVSRPDTFISAGDKALDKLCNQLELRKLNNDPEKYWQFLTSKLHLLPLFEEGLGQPKRKELALIDGVLWVEGQSETNINGEHETTLQTEPTKQGHAMTKTPLNQILYGPPGTGKTYHTIEAAVTAANPEFTWEDRKTLKEEYERLVHARQIRFVTFHQSYGYEDFVEGISAETDESKINYFLKSGIFKQICDEATFSQSCTSAEINANGRVWKISIQSTTANPIKSYCLNNNKIAIGWDATGDMRSQEEDKGENSTYYKSLGRNNQNSLTYFSKEMRKGDLVLCIDSNTSVEAVAVVEDDYLYDRDGVMGDGYYRHIVPVKWLVKGVSVDFKELNSDRQFNLPTCYPLTRMSVSDVIQHFKRNDINFVSTHSDAVNNYVLVIDEINRGNISKIFGELITLIEPSKRGGNDEAIKLTLPHSGKPFFVPNNLYIIGTMNTADRSLAMMDTALRRRFDFIEMMPKPEIFEGQIVKGIDLRYLLETMNKRIEVLYDREHTLGHAFLIPVAEQIKADEEQAFIELKQVFKNKIIPLLEEYFFEDWNKIRLVLGDNRKNIDKLDKYTFVKTSTQTYEDIFGENHGLETYENKKTTFTLANFDDTDSAWNEPKAYQAIYDISVLTTSTENNEGILPNEHSDSSNM